MSELENPQQTDETSVEEQEPELSHSDKLVGIFSEPGKTFESISKFPIRNIDWVLPILAMLVVVVISQLIMMGNPQIKAEMKQKQMAGIEKRLQEQVDKGTLTKQQADEQMQTVEDQMEKFSGGIVGKVITAISVLVFGFIMYLVVAGFYFLIVKFLFKADATYKHVLVSTGLTSYISIIGVILATILAIVTNKMARDVSVASLFSVDTKTLVGFLLAKLDAFGIWAYFVIALGMSKLFKAGDSKKYYYLIFGAWLILTFLVFIGMKTIPFLENFA